MNAPRDADPAAPPAAGPTDAELRLLESRARSLARRVRTDVREDAVDVVVFTLSGEACALELRHLRHVLPAQQLALLPGAEPPLVALAGWRGELIAVIDLARVLGVSAGAPTERRHLLVVGEGAPIALLVDDLSALTSIAPSAVAAAEGERAFVRGVTADAVLVLDGAELIRFLKREAS
jgi:chemotaxis signal transduction protein